MDDGHEKAAPGADPSAASDINSKQDFITPSLAITFTLFTSRDPLSKAFAINDRGQIVKTAAAQMTSGTAQRIETDFYKFGDYLQTLTATQAVGFGTHDNDAFGPSIAITTASKAEPPRSIARTKEYFQYPARPGIVMLDHDPSPYGPKVTPDGLTAFLAEIFPEFEQATRINRPSVSSGVHRIGEHPGDAASFHLYFPVHDAADIPRFGVTLVKRLWLEGHGFIALSKSGAMLERTFIDAAVFSPERLDFQGWPIVGDGLAFEPPRPIYKEGGFLDTRLLPDLDESETAEYEKLVAEAKRAMAEQSETVRNGWIESTLSELVEAGIPELQARKQLRQLAEGKTQTLHDDFVLHFATQGTTTVREVLANPKRFDGQALADPLEGPEYGKTTAKFYLNAPSGKPCLHSFARGMESVYFLRRDKSNDADAVRAAIQNAKSFSDLMNFDGTDGTDGTPLNLKGNSCSVMSNADGTDGTYEKSIGYTEPAEPDDAPKIPSEHERPCYRVFPEGFAAADGKKLRAGVWYFWVQVSKGKNADVSLAHKWVCTPLYIDAVTRDKQDGNFGRLLRFKNTLGRWRQWGMPMELLRGSGEELRGELLAMGLGIDPRSRNEFSRYLQSITPKRKIHCALQVGWHGSNFVLPDKTIGETADSVIFQSGDRNRDEYTVAGNLDDWRAKISAKAIGNPLLMLGLSAAFAGPLLAKCKTEGGGFHLVGDSSTGKTTIVDAACSVWGGENYKRTWNSTANGLEGVAQLFTDCLLALDEINQCEPREIGKIVYALGNGVGKQRASRTGSAREVARWLCFVLSSGERTIQTAMLEGGFHSRAGQEIRLLTVPTSRAHGAFDDLKGCASGAAFSDEIKKSAAEHYGHAGRSFLERLTRETRNLSTLFEQAKQIFSAGNVSDGQEKRAAARFANVGLAGELATEYDITGWQEGAAFESARLGFELWRGTRQGGNDELHSMKSRIVEYIERYGDGRFTTLDYDDEKIRLPERSGYWLDIEGRRQYLFNSVGLRAALAGFDFNRAIKALSAAGVLPEPNRTGEIARKFRIGLRTARLYSVTLDAKNGD